MKIHAAINLLWAILLIVWGYALFEWYQAQKRECDVLKTMLPHPSCERILPW